MPNNNNNNKETPVTNTDPINDFHGNYWFLSNFYQSMHLRARLYGFDSTEAFFQACKLEDHAKREPFRKMKPYDAKQAGKKVELRPNWDGDRKGYMGLKVDVMLLALQRKFTEGTGLANKLIATGDAYLEEGNKYHDVYWGRCYGGCNRGEHEPEGNNILGKLLMWVRDELTGKNDHTSCSKCGTGYKVGIPKGHVAAGGGIILDGKFQGAVGVCAVCTGDGVETVHDMVRTAIYWQEKGSTTEVNSDEKPF